ncbi:MAG: arsenate reductase ArsC [Thermoanaerobaculia bacterium]
MTAARVRVLFLCTGNSARSQMAEAILRHMTKGTLDVNSAGSDPRPEINPLAREAVRKVLGLEMTGQHPKSMNQYLNDRFDYVITVCDRAAEVCPTFPGSPEIIRWSLQDPAGATGTEEDKRRAFENSAKDLIQRIRLWIALPGAAKQINPTRSALARS